jgi:hypothetical protein
MSTRLSLWGACLTFATGFGVLALSHALPAVWQEIAVKICAIFVVPVPIVLGLLAATTGGIGRR